jgi:hypothetical protein
MPELSFRVYFGGEPASVEDLARIEEITVEQTEGAAWEARIVMALCLDEQGNWERQNEISLRPRTQVRVELKIGTADFKPLIDGPIVGLDTAMDARPGRSTATVVVHDDSAWLNLASEPLSTDGRTDEEIARELFLEKSDGHIASTRIELPSDTTPPSLGESFAQLGTPMQMLRHLAERNGCRAFVLPGDSPGASIGCLKPDSEDPPALPPLVLLGAGRNLADVSASEDPESAERTVAHTLRLADQQLVSYTTQAEDETLLEQQPAAPDPPARALPPGANDGEDAAARARARARRRNFPVEYSGRTIPGCYPAILQPRQKIALHAGGARNSTILLLTKVTHRLTPSLYAAEFEGRGNSLASLQGAAPGLPAGIF